MSAQQPRAVLMLTCSRYARYADLSVAQLRALWPSHPPVWIGTDTGRIAYPQTIRVGATSWAGVLSRSLLTLVNRGDLADEDWVLLVLEDHVPSAPVCDTKMAQAVALGERYEAGQVHLSSSEPRLRPGAELTRCDGEPVIDVARDFTWYFSLHPALWRVGYLRKALAFAVQHGMADPWAFERLPERATRHIAWAAVWRSPCHGGYLQRGKVARAAVRRMTHPATQPLRHVLQRQLLMERWRQALRHRWRRVARKLVGSG